MVKRCLSRMSGKLSRTVLRRGKGSNPFFLVEFTSEEYTSYLKSANIRQSMDGKARWVDNVVIERWFRSLKTERIYTHEYLTPRALRIGIREYIQEYNTERPHQTHDYLTPKEAYLGIKKAA
jgi:putative transposase